MLRRLRIIMCTLALTSVQAAASGNASLQKPKKPLPSIVGDKKFEGLSPQSDITVLQFWASWCTGCAQVMAEMSSVLSARKDIGFVSISLDEQKDLAVKYFANKSDVVKATMDVAFLDPGGSMFSEFNGVDSLPFLIFVKKDGTVFKRIHGHPTKADLDTLLGSGGKK